MRKCDRKELVRRPPSSGIGDHRLRVCVVLAVVEEAARVVEQLADRDCTAIRDEPW